MAFTYVLATNNGKVRLLIPDRTSGAGNYFLEDEEIAVMLAMESNNVKRTAALALETMASDEAYVQKMIKLMDLTTNGPAVAEELRARAAALRTQADDEDAATTAEFDWAEWVVNPFSFRERVDKEALRSG